MEKSVFNLVGAYAGSLGCARDDKQLRDWLSPRLSFRPEKSIDFGVEKSFTLFFVSALLPCRCSLDFTPTKKEALASFFPYLFLLNISKIRSPQCFIYDCFCVFFSYSQLIIGYVCWEFEFHTVCS